jgi:hypothetical protein
MQGAAKAEDGHLEKSEAEEGYGKALQYPLFEALSSRKSRRFGVGMEIPEGPNKYKSKQSPAPLTELEEALLISAGTGITGLNLADYPFSEAPFGEDRSEKLKTHIGGGNSQLSYQSRTYPSPCGSHGTALFYTNDDGVYMMKLRDLPRERLEEIASMSEYDRAIALFREHRVKLSDSRLDLPRRQPAILCANLWNANKPGTTLFIPVSDLTMEYINLMITQIADLGLNFVDDLHENRLCGTEKWVQTGLLRKTSAVPLSYMERLVEVEIACESAFMLHNMSLAMQSMGLGGWLFGGLSPPVVMGVTPLAKGLGFRFDMSKNPAFPPNPTGIAGHFEGHCPPHYASMDAAVDDVVDRKWGPEGIFTPGSGKTPFKNTDEMLRAIPRPSDDVIQCVKDICNYIYDTYGQFPGTVESMHAGIFLQAQHIDTEFYDTYYGEGAYTEMHKNHNALWHPHGLPAPRS